MAVTVETLEKLERRITLTLAAADINSEIEVRLKKLARTVKADGFRPGKVPMSVVTQRYGYTVQNEVMNDKIGQAFAEAANEAKLRVAGAPRITEKEGAESGTMLFDAIFEVFPEVKIGSLDDAVVERYHTDITEAAIDRTIEILRKQRRTFSERPAAEPAVETDRVMIDFEGKFDGVSFDGGTAKDFQFVIGEGQMLETFDQAVRGMKVGDSKTFPLRFPDDYQSKEAAGKEADFLVTVKQIEIQQLPELTDFFARTLGIIDGSVDSLRKDVRSNLEREVKARIMTRNKGSVMEVLLKHSELDVPAALVEDEAQRLVEAALADMKQRGGKEVDRAQMPTKIFQPQAERRVRLGLVVSELVRANNLQAKPEQLQAHIEEMAQSYEKPSEVVSWYLGDKQRMAEVELVVVENNVADFVLARGKVINKDVPFDELMAS